MAVLVRKAQPKFMFNDQLIQSGYPIPLGLRLPNDVTRNVQKNVYLRTKYESSVNQYATLTTANLYHQKAPNARNQQQQQPNRGQYFPTQKHHLIDANSRKCPTNPHL